PDLVERLLQPIRLLLEGRAEVPQLGGPDRVSPPGSQGALAFGRSQHPAHMPEVGRSHVVGIDRTLGWASREADGVHSEDVELGRVRARGGGQSPSAAQAKQVAQELQWPGPTT